MGKKWNTENKDSFIIIKNENGAALGLCKNSDVEIIEEDGYAFKNLSKSGKLESYEDWRLEPEIRAKDLAAKLSLEEIAGLMLYSGHQQVPDSNTGIGTTYNAKPFNESGAKSYDISDQQKHFLKHDNLRHVLVVNVENAEIAAKWNNNVQAFVEALGFGIPVNTSSDPRHGTINDAEYNGGAGGDISKWPDGIGMSATFDPSLAKQFGEIAANEYRALGMSTTLSPQIDLATEPRWMRFIGTFGESSKLTIDMAKAYCDGFQTSNGKYEIKDGWGYRSVATMVKHWPGGGSCEAGRDAHYAYGKYAVYPGNNFEEHLKPFTEGAFKLDGKTKQAAAVMPYYSVSYGQDSKNGENVGNSYSEYIIKDLLREKYHYNGVVCTDWCITGDHGATEEEFSNRCWGVEELSVVERHLKIIINGVDQFGGNNDAKPIIEAYRLGCTRYGEEFMRTRFEQSAVRLLTNIFRLGLFENPYLDAAESVSIVGSPEYMRTGYEAQLKSITLIKNRNNMLPLKKKIKVYIPKRHIRPYLDFVSCMTEDRILEPVNKNIVNKYFKLVDSPEEADAAIVFMESPISIGYSPEDYKNGGNGYLPISLQYRPYTAVTARKVSIAGGDPLESFNNRSYLGKINTTANEEDLDNVIAMKKIMKDKPVIVSITMKNPTVMAEFEPYADVIIVNYGVQTQAVLDVMTGEFEPSGLLPLQIPKDMETVEKQREDIPFDISCYTDSEGNTYDFAFGLNYTCVIDDDRTKKYKQ